MTRLHLVAPAEMSAEQRTVHDRLLPALAAVCVAAGAVAARPELADKAQALGRYCRYETCLPPRLSGWPF